MPNQRDPDKAFLGGYFQRTIVRRFHRFSVDAGFGTHVDCLDHLIRDFIKARETITPATNGSGSRRISRPAAAIKGSR